jgi:hypothetical protein
MIAAAGGRIVALDNVSHLQPWLSDALCRISTGGALSTRQLYTDGDEYVVEAVRPCILTGITSVITRGDLLDRAISITLPAISESQRRTEAELWTQYDHLWPSVLGALLDAVTMALAREHDIHLASLPRMADWAVWVTASEPALGWKDETIVNAYRARTQSAVEASLDGDHVALAIRRLTLPWSGRSSDLLSRITPTDLPKGWPPKGWPDSPRGLSAALRRLAPLLRRVRIDVRLPEDARTARERVNPDRNNRGATGRTGRTGHTAERDRRLSRPICPMCPVAPRLFLAAFVAGGAMQNPNERLRRLD